MTRVRFLLCVGMAILATAGFADVLSAEATDLDGILEDLVSFIEEQAHDKIVADQDTYVSIVPRLLRGTPPIVWSLLAPDPLPDGMSIDPDTGQVRWEKADYATALALLPAGRPLVTVCIEARGPGGFDTADWDIKVTPPGGENDCHSADTDGDYVISAVELGRVVCLHNAGVYHVAADTADGYAPGEGPTDGLAHNSDYAPTDWSVSAVELGRLLTLHNAGGYVLAPEQEDGFAPALPEPGAPAAEL